MDNNKSVFNKTILKWGIVLSAIVVIFLLILFRVIIPRQNHIPIANNNKALRLALTVQKSGTETTLEKVVPFEWDDMYIFYPYSSDREDIEKTIGFPLSEYHPAMYDEMISTIFVKNKKLVSYTCDRYENIGYQIQNCEHSSYGDNEIFEIKKENGLITYCSNEVLPSMK